MIKTFWVEWVGESDEVCSTFLTQEQINDLIKDGQTILFINEERQ